MAEGPRRYRKKPLAVFEHGTRIHAPSHGEDCYRVIATDGAGRRLFHKFSREEDARGKARELEAYLASNMPLHRRRDGGCTVRALASLYMAHLAGKSTRYQERQDAFLRCWILPRLGETVLSDWTPAISEEVLTEARYKLAPQTVQALGSCMRSLVTFAHKSRWLPREVDPMWLVSYSTKGEFQGEATGFVPRDSIPSRAKSSAQRFSTPSSPSASRRGGSPCGSSIVRACAGANSSRYDPWTSSLTRIVSCTSTERSSSHRRAGP